MNQIEKYIERLKQLQSLYEVGQPQHNAFGISINEANEMLVKNCIKRSSVAQVMDCGVRNYQTAPTDQQADCNASNLQ